LSDAYCDATKEELNNHYKCSVCGKIFYCKEDHLEQCTNKRIKIICKNCMKGHLMANEQVCKMTTSEINKLVENHICPDCGSKLQNGGNCYVCLVCGWSRC